MIDTKMPDWCRIPEGGWLPGIRGYLQQRVALRSTIPAPEDWKFHSIEALLLHYGRTFTPVKLDEYEMDDVWSPLERGPKGDCFANAVRACMYNGWWYAEGLATAIIPLNHAWVWQPSHPDQAVDPTWDDDAGSEAEYFGIAFDPAWTVEMAYKSGYYGIFGSEQQSVIEPLLRHGIPAAALAEPTHG